MTRRPSTSLGQRCSTKMSTSASLGGRPLWPSEAEAWLKSQFRCPSGVEGNIPRNHLRSACAFYPLFASYSVISEFEFIQMHLHELTIAERAMLLISLVRYGVAPLAPENETGEDISTVIIQVHPNLWKNEGDQSPYHLYSLVPTTT
jgi:hypothetical protein